MFATLLLETSANIERFSSSMKAFFTVLRFTHEIIFIWRSSLINYEGNPSLMETEKCP